MRRPVFQTDGSLTISSRTCIRVRRARWWILTKAKGLRGQDPVVGWRFHKACGFPPHDDAGLGWVTGCRIAVVNKNKAASLVFVLCWRAHVSFFLLPS